MVEQSRSGKAAAILKVGVLRNRDSCSTRAARRGMSADESGACGARREIDDEEEDANNQLFPQTFQAAARNERFLDRLSNFFVFQR